MEGIIVKDTGKYGRGVFALRPFKKGELIEAAPVIAMPQSERKYVRKTKLDDYFFNWGESKKEPAICLGYGSLYNHSYTPNARFINNLKNETIDFYAIRDIEKGEEITVNYNGDPDSKEKVWFKVWDDAENQRTME